VFYLAGLNKNGFKILDNATRHARRKVADKFFPQIKGDSIPADLTDKTIKQSPLIWGFFNSLKICGQPLVLQS